MSRSRLAINCRRAAIVGFVTCGVLAGSALPALAASQAKTASTPYGTLESDVYRSGYTTSGNTLQWNYQVTGKVGGSQSVEQIKTTWTGGASLRNSASFSLAVGSSGVSVGGSSSWAYVSQTKYWSNTNGARLATYNTNMVVAPKNDYRSDTISLQNTAFVKFRGDARNWQITASV